MSLRSLIFCVLMLGSAVLPLFRSSVSAPSAEEFPGWPKDLGGRLLYAVPPDPSEKSFGLEFTGKMKRFTDGEHEILLRWLKHESRTLHPASDCYRGSGYAVTPQPLWLDPQGKHWGCFRAERGAERLQVCERIYDQAGGSWSDTSSWYWHAALGESRGPYWAATLVSREP